MPRKSNKRRTTAHATLRATSPKRNIRQTPAGHAPTRPAGHPIRDRRFDRRPPKFPGRLGGR